MLAQPKFETNLVGMRESTPVRQIQEDIVDMGRQREMILIKEIECLPDASQWLAKKLLQARRQSSDKAQENPINYIRISTTIQHVFSLSLFSCINVENSHSFVGIRSVIFCVFFSNTT